MEKVIEKFYSFMEEKGLKGRVVSTGHLNDLRHEIESRHSKGFFDEKVFKEALSFLSFSPPDNLASATSVIVVAVPRPQTRVSFNLNEKNITLTIPPTYVRYREVDKEIETLLAKWLISEGYHTAPTKLPRKLLAVRSGLAEYGRNNITYIPGMGSFFQLMAFYSDLPCQDDEWLEQRMMERCNKCLVCLNKCPTQAIISERFLLRTERCLVFHNERPPEIPFPDWINPASHNCLIGCMICQQSCPENRNFLSWFEDSEEFSHEETSLFLAGAKTDRLPAVTLEKLKRLGMSDLPEIMPRNLEIFFNRLS